MEKQIPTIEMEISGKKVVIYEWLTLEESTNYSEIALGDTDITDFKKVEEVTLTTKVWGELNKFLIKHLCKSPDWEEINQWKQEDRDILILKLRELISKK